ncbi:MAG TPA: PQQ-binding-like beta-propeller repeat protein [Steroidobacteraceae bacterium]|nr:PQQ-binding-like beta-propeller repeat protein [Steroidobacteraceae bacterium]
MPAHSLKRVTKAIIAAALLGALVLAILIVPDYRWRAIVTARKLTGLLSDVSWRDLGDIARPGSGFALRHLAGSGNPYATIQNPHTSAADRSRGRELFAQNCVKCHGPLARGGFAPALIGRAFIHGDSDWAVYRTITRGVPGTAMVGGLIDRRDTWRVIAYLRDLRETRGARRADISEQVNATVGPAPDATAARLLQSSSEVGEWLLPTGGYDGQRFSRDTQLNVGNVSGLAVQWIHQFATTSAPNESVPVVSGNYLYVSLPPATVYALDARSGAEVWHYTRAIPSDFHVCCLATTRGVAVLGQRVYFGTLDAHLVALDASSGRVLWDQAVADYKIGYSITAAPLPVGDLVITGIAGSEFPIRGFISAYDAATGALRWRFRTVPEPGEKGSETWGRDSWKTGGAATWGIGAYDPALGLLYWGVASAAPDFDASLRPGDNLYANCLLALDVRTGKLVWYFQFLPGDDHDWDSTQTPSLIDVQENGHVAPLVAVANRGGFFYVLDRRTGRFIRAAPFAKQTWAAGLTASGRPIRMPKSSPSAQGTFLYPSVNGATNWWPSSYSPSTGLYYVNVEDGGGLFFTKKDPGAKPGRMYIAGTTAYGDSFSDLVKAIDPLTATVRWERRNSTVTSAPRGGLLATAGGLLFGSDGPQLYALEASTGRQLWSFNAGGHISAPPMTFRIGGQQLIAVVAGQDLITLALPPIASSKR